MKRIIIWLCVCSFFYILLTSTSLVGSRKNKNVINSTELLALRDSLDDINYAIPVYNDYKADEVLIISNQQQWNRIGKLIQSCLQKGNKNIELVVDAKSLDLLENAIQIKNLDYPSANIRIIGNKTVLLPEGVTYFRSKEEESVNASHYARPYSLFDINDVLIDSDNNPLSLYDDSFEITTKIEKVVDDGVIEILNADGTIYKKVYKTWRFKTNLPDLCESECRYFYILLTRNWTSCRHRVLKVENGFIYFSLLSDDPPTLAEKTMDPNVDFISYNKYPRCRFINSPIRKGVYVKNDSVYIPNHINAIRVGKGGYLLSISNCKFNSFEISGFNIIAAGNKSCISVKKSDFYDQMWVKDIVFSNISASAILVENCRNVCICSNTINNTRKNAIRCTGDKLTVCNNRLKRIGFMLQTMAISFSGTNIYIYGNTIEDFNYSAIATGGTESNSESDTKSYIVEKNKISYSPLFLSTHTDITLADCGGIYIGPQNTQGIIRNNVIINMTGIGSNRGIFLDDGAKNLFVYGNLIINTANSYDIDLRLCTTYSKGIPDHNTNNHIFHNILTGGYRFQDTGLDNSNCNGGQNILLGLGERQKLVAQHNDMSPNIHFRRSSYKNGKIIVLHRYSSILETIVKDDFVRNYLIVKK